MHTIIREHVTDEGRHMVFFQRLLKHIWASLDEEIRCMLGQSILGYFNKYLNLDEGSTMSVYTGLLRQLGLNEQDCITVANDTITRDGILPKDQMPSIVNPLHLMKVSGVLEHKPTRDLLVAHGWLREPAIA